MYSEANVIDQVMIDSENVVHVRETRTVLKDGVQIAQTYHRTAFSKGDDISGLPEKIKTICNIVWEE